MDSRIVHIKNDIFSVCYGKDVLNLFLFIWILRDWRNDKIEWIKQWSPNKWLQKYEFCEIEEMIKSNELSSDHEINDGKNINF